MVGGRTTGVCDELLFTHLSINLLGVINEREGGQLLTSEAVYMVVSQVSSIFSIGPSKKVNIITTTTPLTSHSLSLLLAPRKVQSIYRRQSIYSA
jgi:hypothetical protein